MISAHLCHKKEDFNKIYNYWAMPAVPPVLWSGNHGYALSYVAETLSAPNSRGERSFLLWSRLSFFEINRQFPFSIEKSTGLVTFFK